MAATLGDEIILPHDLLPDDTTLIYDDNGTPVNEIDFNDPDNEIMAGGRDHKRYSDLAVAYYNSIHHTDYKVVDLMERWSCLERRCSEKSTWIHCGFSAAPSTAVECESAAAKYFCAELQVKDYGGEEVVTSCRILDGLKTTGCNCSISPWVDTGNCSRSTKSSEEDVPPLSQYSHCLADGVSLSDKAKYRVRFPLLAMAYYNKKQHADYKLVDALPYTVSFECRIVVHCNFIARQNAPADVSNKLFFAELEKRKDGWVVTACRVVRGKTTAGCHICPRHQGKRVIHPTRGFRFGLYPDRRLRCRR